MAEAGMIPTDLGTKKISSLLKEYAVPGIIAMTASSLYNMVDSVYIGHIKDVGSLAISGLSVTSPIMNLGAALGTLVGIGSSTIISVVLGQKNYDAARKVLSNAFTLNIIVGVLFTLVTVPYITPILSFFGAGPAILPYARQYIVIILLGNVVTHTYFGFNSIMRSAGDPKMAMKLTLFTVIANTVLDPVFIFGFGMGVRGAAVATVLCQMMSLAYSLKYFTDKKKFLHLPKGLFGIEKRIAKDSFAIGTGPFLMNSAACIVAMFINQQLAKYGGDLSIGAYGIVNRFNFFFLMIVSGLNQGMQPIAGYNFGARQYSRVKEVYQLTVKWGTVACLVGFIFSEFFPNMAMGIFTNDPALKDISVRGLRIMSAFLWIVGFQMITTNLFQSLGMVKKSIFLSLSRQLLFLVPLVYVLPLFMGIDGVWLSFPVADFVATITTFFMVRTLILKLKKLSDGDDPSALGSQMKQ